jgi:hypothetical protein
MKRLFLALAAILAASPLSAQSWTTGPRTPVWVDNPTIGDGVDRLPEVTTTTQGGDPPAFAYEPVTPNEDGAGPYTRSQWIVANPQYTANLQPKFRISCNQSVFGTFDPVVYPGIPNAGHHHTFIGTLNGVDENTTSERLRTVSTSSACTGGPLNKTLYWEPTLFFEQSTGVFRPVKPNVASFYYTMPSQAFVEKLIRLPMGLQFIGGVNPDDPEATARMAEIPDGQGWLKTRKYDGWLGWACYNGGTLVSPTASEDEYLGYSRVLVNSNGSDPWAGACQNPNFVLIANAAAPTCWDGYNLKAGATTASVTAGRDHFRYPIYKVANQSPDAQICPNGWWKVPSFEVKSEFPNGRPGIAGHAWRSKLFLSSDRMSANPANWRPRGSTFHFDWLNGWDTVVLETWQRECLGMTVKGTPGADGLNGLGKGNDCDTSTISATQSLATGVPPVAGRSNNPIITFHNYAVGPTKEAFGALDPGTVVSGTVNHDH